MGHRIITREQLEDMYINRAMSLRQIGEKVGVGLRTVGKWLQRDGIAARPRGAPCGCNAGPRKAALSKEELVDLYITKGMTQRAIGEMYGVNDTLIGKRLEGFGIESRPTNWEKNAPRFVTMPADDLRRLYVSERRTQKEIAGAYGLNPVTVSKWLRRYGIPIEAPWERRAIKIDSEELRRLYSDQGMTIRQMAKYFRCSVWTVQWNMREHGIVALNAGHKLAKREVDIANPRELRSTRGYTRCHDIHGNAVKEHRMVAEEAMGRTLFASELIHHINRIKADNRIENLAVLPSNAEHRQAHHYLEIVGAYLAGLSPIRPAPLEFAAPVFWGGRYVTSIDLIPSRAVPGQLDSEMAAATAVVKEIVN